MVGRARGGQGFYGSARSALAASVPPGPPLPCPNRLVGFARRRTGPGPCVTDARDSPSQTGVCHPWIDCVPPTHESPGSVVMSATTMRSKAVARRTNMNPERREFLSLPNPPARLSTAEAAWFIGCAVHDIAILVAAGLLKPLGHPPPNGSKYFATATLILLRNDLKWLARASDALVEHWKAKNGRRSPITPLPTGRTTSRETEECDGGFSTQGNFNGAQRNSPPRASLSH